MNFLLGFGVSCFINSLKGEYDFVIFDLIGSTFDKMSDVIVIAVIGLACLYMLYLFMITIRKR